MSDKPEKETTANENEISSDTSLESEDASAPEIDAGMAAQLDEFMKKMQRGDELEREVAEWKTRCVRLQQDFESYRTRTTTDLSEAKTNGQASAVEAMLGTFDDISRAIDAGVKEPSTLIPGLETVRTNFLKSLTNLGCEAVPGKGEAFDPHVHEAIGTVSGEEDDKIAEVFQAGFTLNGKLVRPARVTVSKRSN